MQPPRSGPAARPGSGEDADSGDVFAGDADAARDDFGIGTGANPGGDQGMESTVPRVPRSSLEPSPADREHHEATGHAVYRPWCEACIRGKSRRHAHRSDHGQGRLPELHFDFCEIPLGSDGVIRTLVAKAPPWTPILFGNIF